MAETKTKTNPSAPATAAPAPSPWIVRIQSWAQSLEALIANPVVIKELRSRMRGGRAFVILTVFLLILSFVSYGLFQIVASTQTFGGGLISAMIGQTLFTGLSFFELFLVLFITPALTAGSISSEFENLTYEMLFATPLKPRTILWGKLVSSMSYVLLLIFAAIPLASLVFLFGGVAPMDALKALLMLVVTTLTFGVVGLFFSALTRRTARATVLSYSFLLFVTVGTLFLFVLWGVIRGDMPPRFVVVLNPFSAMASVLSAGASGDSRFAMGFPLEALAGEMDVLAPDVQTGFRPTWHFTIWLYSFLSIVLYLVSTQLIKPIRRWHIGRAGIATVALLSLLFIAGGYLLFQPVPQTAQRNFPNIGHPLPVPRREIRPVIIEEVPPPYPLPTPAAPLSEEDAP